MNTKTIALLMTILFLVSMLSTAFNIASVVAEATMSEPTYFGWGNGTYFEVTNSTYLNVTLTSTEIVLAYLESVPKVVSLFVENNSSATSTVFIFTGFEPNTTYYRYQDGNLMGKFTTDSSGGYTYTQDILEPHHVYIQEETSTLYISSDYTFTSNIYEPIVVVANNIVIDGNGYTLQGPGSGYGFYMYRRSGVTIKNVTVKGWANAIYAIRGSSYNAIIGNNISSNVHGVCFWWYSSSNTIANNTLKSNSGYPISMRWGANYNIVTNNTCHSNLGQIDMDGASYNRVSDNALYNNQLGIATRFHARYNSITNNIIVNTRRMTGGIRGDTDVRYNTIMNNTIKSNGSYGLYFANQFCNNIISGNTIMNNTYGILFRSSCSGNTIYHNNIVENVVQADDDNPANNNWHHPDLLEGNYWSDYPGVDDGSGTGKHTIAGDDIGDTHIPWPGPYYDYYPLIHPSIYTPTGTNVVVTDPITGIVVTFDEVISSGVTTVTTSDVGPAPPTGFIITGQYFEITTTATYTGMIEIAIPYDETQVQGQEENLRLKHWNPEGAGWNDITTWVDTINNIMYGEVPSLSVFAVMELIDTTPPETTVSLSNIPGLEGWYVSDVIVTLTATDDISGVALTVYSFDEATWIIYTGPFTITTEGITTVYYSSTDVAGNVEATKTETIKIDKTAPILKITTPTDYSLYAEGLVLDFSATDAISGVSSIVGDLTKTSGESQEVESGFKPEQGVYTLVVRTTDKAGNTVESSLVYFVVYDPDDGFVTGGGWIDSPEGAYTADPSLTGKASFGFVSKYKRGASTPTGNTQFIFSVADLNFHSTSYDWLVVAGPKAQFKGTGTINGEGEYGFLLTATDSQINGGGDTDKFRIKIWSKTEGESVIYDNKIGEEDAQDIAGGSIVIHKAKE